MVLTNRRRNMRHVTQTHSTKVHDGNEAPSQAALDAAREQRESPSEVGHRHAQGHARFVERFAWACNCGKSANGCTYPNRSAARIAGDQHADSKNMRDSA
jgi:hypothetical protein